MHLLAVIKKVGCSVLMYGYCMHVTYLRMICLGSETVLPWGDIYTQMCILILEQNVQNIARLILFSVNFMITQGKI